MNLQVARSIAEGHGFTRDYGGVTSFPREIETSGVYTFLAALVIKLWGVSFFTLALPNLIFLAVLLVTISVIFRPWPVASLLAPSLVVLATAGMSEFAGGGYGEMPTVALLLPALMLQGAVIAGARRPALRLSAAFLLMGLAATVKVVAIAVLPAMLLGLLLVVVVRKGERRRWLLLLTPLAAAVPLALYELYRLASLGTSGYASYWRDRAESVGAQSGVTSGGRWGGLLSKVADHGHLLAVQTGLTGLGAALLVAVPAMLAVLAFLFRGVGWREWLARPQRALFVLLAVYGYSYWAWWLAVTPTEKAWLRRVIIGILVLSIAYGLLLCFAVERLAEKRATRDVTAQRLPLQVVAGVVVVAALVSLSVVQFSVARTNFRGFVLGSNEMQAQVSVAADEVRDFADEARPLFGGGWWSAPVISLLSDVPFGDLTELDPCSAGDVAKLADDRAVFVWDRYGMGIVSKTPTQIGFEFTKIGEPSPYASFWTLTFATGACAADVPAA